MLPSSLDSQPNLMTDQALNIHEEVVYDFILNKFRSRALSCTKCWTQTNRRRPAARDNKRDGTTKKNQVDEKDSH